MDAVKKVHGTLGVYDIVARIESEKPDTVKRSNYRGYKKINYVKSTLTLLGAGDIDTGENMAELIPDIIPEEKKPLEEPTDTNQDEDFNDEDDDYDDGDFEEKIILN